MSRNVRFSPKAVKTFWAVSAVEPWYGLGEARLMKSKPPFLRAWRKKMKLTQVALANKLGTDHTTVGRYERGELRVDAETFRKIAEVYGVTVAELNADPNDQAKARHMHRLMEGWAVLDDDDARAIADMAERLAAAKKK